MTAELENGVNRLKRALAIGKAKSKLAEAIKDLEYLDANLAEDGQKNRPADYLIQTIAANIDNFRLPDAEFRQFVRNSVPVN